MTTYLNRFTKHGTGYTYKFVELKPTWDEMDVALDSVEQTWDELGGMSYWRGWGCSGLRPAPLADRIGVLLPVQLQESA